MPAITITKEFLDSLPEKDILMIRDYIWERFGNKPSHKVPGTSRESHPSKEEALRKKR
jgi:hypothetical protein